MEDMLPEFIIVPMEGADLDITRLLKDLEEHPRVVQVSTAQRAVYRLPGRKDHSYVVCWTEEQARRVQARIAAGRSLDKFHGSVGIIEATAHAISVYQAAPTEVVEQIAILLLPVLQAQRWRVFSEGDEVTSTYNTEPERLFF